MYFMTMDKRKFKHQFLKSLGSIQPFEQLMDLLPDVAFYVKDSKSRFVMMNRRNCEICHVASEMDAIGKTDHDLFPRDRADLYVARDKRIMRTGIPTINVVSPAPEEEGSDHLVIGSKLPLRDRQGHIIGVTGIHRAVEGMRAAPKSYGPFARAIQHIHEHYAEPTDTKKVAAMVGMSARQFNRRFQRFFRATLCQYLMRVRINAACRLLTETDHSVTEISGEVGFYDQSHFSRTFIRLMGTSPLKYRKHHLPD